MNSPPVPTRVACRRGASAWLTVLLTVMLLIAAAFASDLSSIVLLRAQLQSAADAAALAAASSLTRPRDKLIEQIQHDVDRRRFNANVEVTFGPDDVREGTWHADRRTFTRSASQPNAIRITARSGEAVGAPLPIFFSSVFDRLPFARRASAVAMAMPRDIALVVDLSGSMNDDTEPCRSTVPPAESFGLDENAHTHGRLLQQVYDDFGYGESPGAVEQVGQPFGIVAGEYAYAQLTRNGGPLTKPNVAARYRIEPDDDELLRKRKAYRAIIDMQIARLMPRAKPIPSSTENFDYWEKYLDFIMWRVKIGRDGPGGPPHRRGWLPPIQDADRLGRMHSDSATGVVDTSASDTGVVNADRSDLKRFCNMIGYVTYVQFMMDHGRDKRPIGGRYVPLSQYSPDCPWHTEETAGGRFRFPPREQPTHAVRRALIAAIAVVKQHNRAIAEPNQRDRVSIITFDRLTGGGPRIAQPLTDDYDAAMKACTTLQAVGDNGASTAMEAGILAAKDHLRMSSGRSFDRDATDKVIVLVTDGIPNLYASSNSQIARFAEENPSDSFYTNEAFDKNAPLMQAAKLSADGWSCYPLAVGRQADRDFVNRLAHMAHTNTGTDDEARRMPGSGDPADSSKQLAGLLQRIITHPAVRVVQ